VNRFVLDNESDDPILQRVGELVDDLLEGQLSPEASAELEKLVSQREDAQAFYVRYIHLWCSIAPHVTDVSHGVLSAESLRLDGEEMPASLHETMILPAVRAEELAADLEDAAESPLALPPAGRLNWTDRWFSARRALLVAVLLISCVLVGGLLLWDRSGSAPATTATLVDSVGASWQGPHGLANGNPVPLNVPLELTEGLGRIACAQTDLILEGPAKMTILSAGKIRLERGRLWIHAGSKSGFEVLTPGGVVKDLGTEFGVNVQSAELESVHVFAGEVSVWAGAADKPAVLLDEGEAIRFDVNGEEGVRIEADLQAFVRPEEFARAAVAAKAEELLRAPSLVAHFTFAEVGGKPVVNTANDANAMGRQVRFGFPADGRVMAPMTPSRRAGQVALQLDPHQSPVIWIPADAAKPLGFTHGPGRVDAFTVAAWVRAHREQAAAGGACIVSYALGIQEQYSLDIQDQVFSFSVWDAQGKAHRLDAKVGPDDQWHMVVGTFDPDSGAANLYVDGKLQATLQGPHRLASPGGEFRFGTRSSASGSSSVNESFLDGAIDEVMLWRGALGGEEVSSLYRAGG
jgi:hypothetical protein